MGKAFLDFNAISEKIQFKDVLDYYNLGYSETREGLKGHAGDIKKPFSFIVSPNKNLFISPGDDNIKGGIINFVSAYENLDLRSSAQKLYDTFLATYKEKEIPELKLEYCEYLKEIGISEELATQYEIGLFKGKGIMAGRISFKIYDKENKKLGYIGYSIKKEDWFYPKGFKRPVYLLNKKQENLKHCILVSDPFDCLYLRSIGFDYTFGLLASSMTATQEEDLKTFQRILLIHKDGENTANRLNRNCFVKYIKISKKITELNKEEVKNFF